MARSHSPTTNNPSNGLDLYTLVITHKSISGDMCGYLPSYFIDQIGKYCSICRCIPKHPYLTPCNHLYCHTCLTRIANELIPCVVCNKQFSIQMCQPNLHLAQKISQASIRCPYNNNCAWAGSIEQLTNHFMQCSFIKPIYRSWLSNIQIALSKSEKQLISFEHDNRELTKCFTSIQDTNKQQEAELDKMGKQLSTQVDNVSQILRDRAIELLPPSQPMHESYIRDMYRNVEARNTVNTNDIRNNVRNDDNTIENLDFNNNATSMEPSLQDENQVDAASDSLETMPQSLIDDLAANLIIHLGEVLNIDDEALRKHL